MKKDLENIFKDLKDDFDFAEPNIGHFERFEAKLKSNNKGSIKNRRIQWHWLAIAASVILFFGFWLGNYNSQNSVELADVSPKMEETQNFYLATIQNEIEQIKSQQTPENQQIINDAFVQLENLEKNYKQLTIELKESNEDKRVIYAMIANFQKRIEVLQNLVDQLEDVKEFENLILEDNKV